MNEQLYSLDFGTSTLQWARIDLEPGRRPALARQEAVPNVLQVNNNRVVAFGDDAADATPAYLDSTFTEYKMSLNGDDTTRWTRKVSPQKLTQFAMKWLLQDPLGLPAMGYSPSSPLVIGVPGHWEQHSKGRAVLIKAAENAGAQQIHLIPEPYAALLWWLRKATGRSNSTANGAYTMVYDFGGGTLDIALLTESDTHDTIRHGAHVVGGKDFDLALERHFASRILRQSDVEKVSLADRLVIRRACRKLKEKLSRVPEAGQALSRLEALPRGCDLEMSRQEFQEVCKVQFQTAVDVVRTTMARNQINPRQITRVLLTGGSSKLWSLSGKLMEALPHLSESDFFVGASPQNDVACGLAVFGAEYYADIPSAARRIKKMPTDAEVEAIVQTYTIGTAAAVGLNPIPLVDIAAGVGLNLKMIIDVAAAYGEGFGEEQARALGSEIVRCMGGMVLVYGISSVLKMFIVGAALQAGVAGYFTFITGLAAREYFKRGASWGDHGAASVVRRLKEKHPPVATIKNIAKRVKDKAVS